MADFNELLDPTAAPVVAPPEKRGFMDSITDLIANVGGHSVDTESAYQRGRLHSAQTETALMQARERRAKAMDEERITAERERFKEQARALGVDPAIALNISAGYNPEQMTGATLDQQTGSLTDLIADPTSDPLKVNSARAALAPGSYNRFYQPATGMIADNATAADPTLTPVGDAQILADKALAGQRDRSPAAGAGGAVNSRGEKAPIGRRWSAEDDSILEPIVGGPADPNAPGTIGAREAVYLNRVLGAATQGVASIKNIMQLPVGASAGVLGIGAQPGVSIWDAGRDALRNSVASQDVQSYNRMIAGLTRNLATIEGQGLVPAGTFVNSYDSLALREGDTELTKLQALAEMRQTIEAGLEPALNSPRVPEQTRQFIQKLIDDIKTTVPFTWNDLFEMEGNPDMTLGQLAQSKGLGGGSAPTTPGTTAGVLSPEEQAELEALRAELGAQ